jgi:hypothetical protein
MTKLTNSILTFTAGSDERKNAYIDFVEYYNTYKDNKASNEGVSFNEMNEKMLAFFTDEVIKMSGKNPENYGDMAQFCNTTDVKEAAFAIVGMITDLIIPDALMKDLGYICEIKNGAWGETLKVVLKPRDLFVVSKGGRNRRTYDIVRQFSGERTVVAEQRGITVGISLYDVLTGRTSLAEFVSKAVQSIETEMRYDIYDAFAAFMATLPATAGAGQLRISGYTQDSAIALAQKIQAWNGGAKAIFLGTKLALSKILPASTNYRFALGDEYVKLGHLRELFGFDCIELEQIADYTTEFAVKLPDNRIFILSPGVDKMVKVFVEGSTLANTSDAYAHANLQQDATLYKSYGIGTFSSAIAGLIEL